jgi:glyoxylase-like metal-dependent hydrolase (beta-lactamase superfamily II)/rhodanese-related sulfurtransferase
VTSSELVSSIQASELVPLLDSDGDLYMIDVRNPDEVAEWQIPGVHNIPLARLASRRGEIPEGAHLVVICAKGARALQGAEILAGHGVASSVLEGGMGAWGSTYDSVIGDFEGAKVVQLRRRGKGCLSYVIGAGSACVVVDPSLDLDKYVDSAAEHGWTITHVLDTHLHADHISGARGLVERTGAALWLNPSDPFDFDFEPLRDGSSIELAPGIHLSVSAVSVPGHTEGSTMYQLGGSAIFTGDTLFLESVGRPDLADQAEVFAHNLYRSLHERVLPLGDEVVVFPAHYGAGVEVHAGEFVARPLGALRSTLPALTLSEAEFVAWAIANVKDRPPNYQHIVLINAGRETAFGAAELELGPNRCAIA